MLFAIDPRDRQPIYRQLAGQIRRAVGEGRLGPGDRLPAVRQLAQSLDINLHTVRQAYAELQREGLVDMRRGRGVTVVASGPMARVNELARQVVEEGRRLGLSEAQIIRTVEVQL